MRTNTISSSRPQLRARRLWSIVIPFYAFSAFAQQAPKLDLADASLEQLMNIQVTSVSKKEQKMSKVAAATFVITQDEIHRSGATNIPDLLRMVPGLDVAQLAANAWAVSARGFNGRYANKLLVLIDGRSVYNPAFSGVLWDQEDVPLPDIDRIEVIRGPGATLWGANAVNGVINIVTKSSTATQGGLIEAAAGSQLGGQGLIQYGGAVGGAGTYRAFSTYSDYRPSINYAGQSASDGWHLLHGGFRSDWNLPGQNALTVEGDLYNDIGSESYQGFSSLAPPYQRLFSDETSAQGGDLLGRWTHSFSPKSDIALQMYYDRYDRLITTIRGTLDTADFDFQHHFALGQRHDIVWGAGYRIQPNTIYPGLSVAFVPVQYTNSLANAFIQDEIALSNQFWLTLGTKFENNNYTGSNWQPSARALWAPSKHQSVWGAVSSALRQPSRRDVGIREEIEAFPTPTGLVDLVLGLGNPDIEAEQLSAYELGYRYEPNKLLSLDVATFFNEYHHLLSSEVGTPFLEDDPSPLHVVIPFSFANKMNGTTYGGEFSSTVNLSRHWKISPGYSWLKMELHPYADSTDTTPYGTQGDGPEHQFQIRSYLTPFRNFDFDTSLYYVSRLADQNIPAYARLDARLAYRIGESVELSVVGQNLLDNQHIEFNEPLDRTLQSLVRRSAYAKVTWKF